MVLFAIGLIGLLVLMVPALRHVPGFGGSEHPLRDLAIKGAVGHQTANAVSSVNFDQRSFDTLGEELILLASIAGAGALLRPRSDERERLDSPGGYVLSPIRLLTYVLFPVTTLIGIDVVIHGHVTPGGGFQGGIVLATGLHLLYVGGTFESLERLRPLETFKIGEAIGAGAFMTTGLAALFSGVAFLSNVLPFGSFAALLSGGTVPVLSIAVGIEVASSTVVLLAAFLKQALSIQERVNEGQAQ
jgi:multicomponent Na+:H+ antiporter subunit B